MYRNFEAILLLALIGGAFLCLFLLNKRVQGFSDKDITEISSNNKRLIDINKDLREKANNIISENKKLIKENRLLKSKAEEVIKESKKEPTSLDELKKLPKYLEYTYILTALGGERSNSLKDSELWQSYVGFFKDKQRIDFNTSINYLKTEGYIYEFEDGVTSEISWEITPKGFVLIEQARGA